MDEDAKCLEYLKNRSNFLKNTNPKDPKCKMCDNNVDRTMLGVDTLCPYHRMLWDSFMYEALGKYGDDIEKVREEFAKWNKTLSKKERDKIVIEMTKDPLNWAC